uniref:hypothetical protein n=1 Tax=Nocardia brasiliensis TaxID=37326 RepID=UPI0024555986
GQGSAASVFAVLYSPTGNATEPLHVLLETSNAFFPSPLLRRSPGAAMTSYLRPPGCAPNVALFMPSTIANPAHPQ